MKPLALLVVLLAVAALSGCETVVFQAPPVAAQQCDQKLVGNWLSVGDTPDKAGEVELWIKDDCTLLFVENEHGASREGEPTALHVGRDGHIAYAWVDARWADRRMALSPESQRRDEPSTFAAGDIVLMQYRVSGGRLELRNADPKQFAHRVIDDRIKGTVTRDDQGHLAVRVSAPVDPKQLRDAKLFPRGEMRFRRNDEWRNDE